MIQFGMTRMTRAGRFAGGGQPPWNILTTFRAIRARGLTQKQAVALCGTDQPTLSKDLSGRMTSISMDQLTRWLNALGRSVEIKVKRAHGPATTVVVGA
jgi:transcriptional regulator with XRE-family HTH domain